MSVHPPRAAVVVDVLGDRWTPLVIRELMIGSDAYLAHPPNARILGG